MRSAWTKMWVVGAVVVAAGGLAVASAAADDGGGGTSFTVAVHSTGVAPTPPFSAGQSYAVSNVVTSPSTHQRLGTLDIACVVNPSGHADCQADFAFNDGSQLLLAGQAPFPHTASDVFSLGVVGGTGQYRHARGDARIVTTTFADSTTTFDLD